MVLKLPTSHLVKNTGSAARDYCMLERNILSHIKLGILLSLLSASLLLNARLVPQTGRQASGSVPLASIEFTAAMLCVAAGAWEYYHGYQDLKQDRAFMVGVKSHLTIMTVVAGVVFSTCIVFIIRDSQSS